MLKVPLQSQKYEYVLVSKCDVVSSLVNVTRVQCIQNRYQLQLLLICIVIIASVTCYLIKEMLIIMDLGSNLNGIVIYLARKALKMFPILWRNVHVISNNYYTCMSIVKQLKYSYLSLFFQSYHSGLKVSQMTQTIWITSHGLSGSNPQTKIPGCDPDS